MTAWIQSTRPELPFMPSLFRAGELFDQYADCPVLSRRHRYVLEDEPAGGIHDRHPVNKIVAQRLSGGCA